MVNSSEPPVIEESPEYVVIKYETGANVTFSCTAQGFPRPTITWTHNNEPAIVSRFIQADTNLSDDKVESVLTMTDVTARDSGPVSCIATVTPGGEVTPLKTTEEAALSILSKRIAYTFSVLSCTYSFTSLLCEISFKSPGVNHLANSKTLGDSWYLGTVVS